MLTKDEVIQLILYLIVATALLLASRGRAETVHLGGARQTVPTMELSQFELCSKSQTLTEIPIDRIKLHPIL